MCDMLKVDVHASRYYKELPVQRHTLRSKEDLESFIQWVLNSEEHCVFKIECTDLNKTFECKPFDYDEHFIEFAENYFGVEESQKYFNKE